MTALAKRMTSACHWPTAGRHAWSEMALLAQKIWQQNTQSHDRGSQSFAHTDRAAYARAAQREIDGMIWRS